MTYAPQLVVCISGKRKSGKDYIAERLARCINDELQMTVEICRISEPLKTEYARIHCLDTNRLLTSDAYKEQYRLAMIEWGENIRHRDHEYFCRRAIDKCNSQLCIVSDCRRPSDIRYFVDRYNVLTVRVNASLAMRMQRGFEFKIGIDDADSECALDEYDRWNAIVHNDDERGAVVELMRIIELKLKEMKEHITTNESNGSTDLNDAKIDIECDTSTLAGRTR